VDKIIFCQGGLGDHLALSTLPEEFSKLGHDVYLYKNYLVRNDQIFNLVWRLNPFIKGFSEQCPNSGHIFSDPPNGSIPWMSHVERTNGIFSNNLSPKIYRHHNKIDYLKDKIILNLECISADYDIDNIIKLTKELIKNKNIDKNNILHLCINTNVNQYKNSFHNHKDIHFPMECKNLDYIVSSHCLEHLENWVDVLDYWYSKLKIGGILFLYLPDYSQLYWRPWNNRKHKTIFSSNIIYDYMISKRYKNIFKSGIDLNNSFMIFGEKC